jgi:transcription antitermination factor NusG
MGLAWYALRSKVHKEHALWKEAQARGYEIYYPRLHVNPVNPRARRVVPYFPGYMFIRLDLEQAGRKVIDRMPFSIGLVSFGGEAGVVPDTLIHGLIKRLESSPQDSLLAKRGFQCGDPVLIDSGPFEGYEAIFDTSISGQERVKVLVELLNGRFIRLDVSLDEIERRR